MLKDSDTPRYAELRTKHTYCADTKAQLLAACGAPGASIAAVASANGMNANVLHRWLKESSQAKQPIGGGAGTGTNAVEIACQSVESFIALPLLMKPAESVAREMTASSLLREIAYDRSIGACTNGEVGEYLSHYVPWLSSPIRWAN